MDCDGLKKAFIADKDGSMLGERGTILAFSEFAWDADPRRGTGDYRLPQTMLTDVNGDPVEIEGMADYVARGMKTDCIFSFEHVTFKAYPIIKMKRKVVQF